MLCMHNVVQNAKDIIACGFDVTKTFIFSDFEYVGGAFYRNIIGIQRWVPLSASQGSPTSRLSVVPGAGCAMMQRGACCGPVAHGWSAWKNNPCTPLS